MSQRYIASMLYDRYSLPFLILVIPKLLFF